MKLQYSFFILVLISFGFALEKNVIDPDTQATIKMMKDLPKQYQSIQPDGDSLFVVTHSVNEWFEKEIYKEGNFPVGADEKFSKAKVRDVIGPFVSGSKVTIYKILEKKELPDSIEQRAILISYQGALKIFGNDSKILRTKTEALAKADSIRSLIVSGQLKMEDCVSKFSDDKASIPLHGDYGWITPDCLFISEYKYPGLINSVGSTVISNTPYGYFIIQVLKHAETHHVYTIVSKISQEVDHHSK